MKLNNQGWSLNTLMVCISIFCIALLVSTFYVYRLGTKLRDNKLLSPSQPHIEKVPYKYQDDMQSLSAATSVYLQEKNIEIQNNEKLIIDMQDLVSANLMTPIKDSEYQVECNGYTLITSSNNNVNIKPYLNCESYTTEGYGEF